MKENQREWLNGELRKGEQRLDGEIPKEKFHELLESVEAVATIDLEKSDSSVSISGPAFRLPGDRGGVLFKVLNGTGPTSYKVVPLDLSMSEKTVTVPVASSGTTWALLSLSHVPDGTTRWYVSLDPGSTVARTIPIRITAPPTGRLKIEILSDDSGQPTPAMVQLQWLFDGSTRPPGRTVDFTSQFDSQARTREQLHGSRTVSYPGMEPGHYWVCSGPFDMALPPGDWRITILRGIEHLTVVDTVSVKAGSTTKKIYRPKRWVHMADRGWYSGDDHVHMQIQSDADAERLLVWAQAEDTHLLNILEMGDHERTFFQQRAFGKSSRTQLRNTVLVPGQEDPRIAHLGHTIALNISEPVRDTSKYYLHDWVYDTVNELGGLYGYAHVNRGLFNIERDLSLNIPKGKVDFVELLQFHHLGTELYYHFLNLGEKVTASAGSDVPWGGTVGEVRVYAHLGELPFSADAWFNALEEGRTFVTNGPMIEFSVDDSLPGDQIDLNTGTKSVLVKARAWGHPNRFKPVRLEVVRLGEVIQTAKSTGSSSSELELVFEIDPGPGCWLAARAYADDGSAAHTTPIYLKRPNFRFWKHAQVPALIDRSLESLNELEILASNIANPKGMDTEHGTGSLIGAWYARPDLVRAKGMDFYDSSEKTWGNNRPKRSSWSARWQGVLTIPENQASPDLLYLKSSGASTLAIDDRVLIGLRDRGEGETAIRLQPGKAHKIILTYNHLRTPVAYLHLAMSRDGGQKHAIPDEWFSFTDQDYRDAYFNSLGSAEEQRTLGNQAPALIKRIKDAREIYSDLLREWESEKGER
ncbi:MAG: CehA/McbA family metallohydrolase [Verrucomicrobia bacterium]|nr:CehA/McbA family metallohydrolase [Verrucomicrobiota bacterium]